MKKNIGVKEESASKRPFPRVTLEDALKISVAIKDKNGGNSWQPSEVAKAIGLTAKSTTFFYKTSGSQAYGLTKGTRDARHIELDTLGREIVYAASPKVELENKQKAFFNVEIFKKVFEYYKGSNLPETKYLSNILQSTFKLPLVQHEEFVKIFKSNCDYLNLRSAGSVGARGVNEAPVGERPSDTAGTIVLSQADDKDAKDIFVVMPFKERNEAHPEGYFQEVLNSLITPAAVGAGFNVRTAAQTGSDIIQSTIIKALRRADLVIADLTEHNPNVLFELGVRIAEAKPVLLIRAKGTAGIFDVDNLLRVFDYNPNLWKSTVQGDVEALSKHIVSAWDDRDNKSYIAVLGGE